MLKKRLTDRQIGVAYDYLTRDRPRRHGRHAGAGELRRRINTVAPDATASAQRGSILDIGLHHRMGGPADEAKNLAWVRAFYRELFADTGGVPVPGERTTAPSSIIPTPTSRIRR